MYSPCASQPIEESFEQVITADSKRADGDRSRGQETQKEQAVPVVEPACDVRAKTCSGVAKLVATALCFSRR
jgi:hypothetical protein